MSPALPPDLHTERLQLIAATPEILRAHLEGLPTLGEVLGANDKDV